MLVSLGIEPRTGNLHMQIRVHNTCVKMRQDAPNTELSPVVTFQIAKVIA